MTALIAVICKGGWEERGGRLLRYQKIGQKNMQKEGEAAVATFLRLSLHSERRLTLGVQKLAIWPPFARAVRQMVRKRPGADR